VAASQQNPAIHAGNDIESGGSRCVQVMQVVRMLSLANMTVTPEIRTADDACGQYRTALQNRELEKAQQAFARAVTVLDQFNLTAQKLFTLVVVAAKGVDPRERFYALANLAKIAFNLGNLDDAQVYAQQLLREAPKYPKDWNYGNAIYYGNFVLGRVALRKGNVQLAGQHLLDAGSTPGSPQLNSFGPNLTLAKELLERGQGPVVLQFFARCKNFWKMDRGKLDEWSATIRGGGIPEFTQNLNY
jgi:tetratricopeptide (TPR) repeat protein